MLGVLVPLVVTAAVFCRPLPVPAEGRAAVAGAPSREPSSAAVACQAIQFGLSWYLAGPADFTRLYGSAGAVLAFLLFVYLSARRVPRRRAHGQ